MVRGAGSILPTEFTEGIYRVNFRQIVFQWIIIPRRKPITWGRSGTSAGVLLSIENLIVLHCVSGYPSDPAEANLNTMCDIGRTFNVVTGLSDHSHGIAVPVAATALRASVIEKHLTLSRAEGGVDSDFSLEPHEFSELVTSCAAAHAAMGRVHYDLKESEKENQRFRRSLYAVTDICKGAPLTAQNCRSIRPGLGLKPKYYDDVIGMKATRDIARGSPLTWDMLQKS